MKSQKKYLHTHFRNLREYLQLYNKQRSNPEILHDIRVELKKIKALFHLLDFCSHSFIAKQEYKPFKKIFRSAGRIRKIDIIDKVLKENTVHERNLDEALRIKRKKHISSFKKNIPEYRNEVKKYDKKMKKCFNQASIDCLKNYVLNKEKEVQLELFPRIYPNKLHESRKLMKEIIYLFSLCNYNSANTKNYHFLQDVIGDWHDKQMVIRLLRKNRNRSTLAIIKKLKAKSNNDIKKIKLFLSEVKQLI